MRLHDFLIVYHVIADTIWTSKLIADFPLQHFIFVFFLIRLICGDFQLAFGFCSIIPMDPNPYYMNTYPNQQYRCDLKLKIGGHFWAHESMLTDAIVITKSTSMKRFWDSLFFQYEILKFIITAATVFGNVCSCVLNYTLYTEAKQTFQLEEQYKEKDVHIQYIYKRDR